MAIAYKRRICLCVLEFISTYEAFSMAVLIGYARTSTIEQVAGFEDQKTKLVNAGCIEFYSEQISSVAKERPEFDAMLRFARRGDTIVATKIDRLARNASSLLRLVELLGEKQVALRILDPEIDTLKPMGKFLLTLLGGLAEMERTQMLERQRIGIERARRDKKYRGRKPVAADKVAQIKQLKAEGRRPTDIARLASVARSTVYKVIGQGG